MGLPASGKSTLARAFSEYSGWPVVDRDRIRAAMFPQGQFTPEEKDAASEATLASLGVHLQQGRSCVADGKPYSRQAEREHLEELARRCGAAMFWVWVDCPLEIAMARIAADRAHPGRDGREELVREVARRWQPPGAEALRLDGLQPGSELLPQLLAALRASAAPSPTATSA